MTAGADRCAHCSTDLERPGDFCLTCRSANADAVVVVVDGERATVTVLRDGSVLGETVVATTAEPDPVRAGTARRNYAGRLVDEVRRKRPEAVYLAGDRELAQAIRARLHFPCYRVDEADPIAAALAARGERDLEVVETPPAEKVGGRHTTLIGGRAGRRAVLTVAGHPHVKKVVPGPIESGGASGQSGVRAKVTRADDTGNLRLLIRDGSSVQENRVVTTARDRDLGERIAEDVNDRLVEAELD
jgi:hypothetical protein